MKLLGAKKQRSPWLHFAITGTIVVLLSLGISQMLPKSHPLRALRKFNEQPDSTSKPVEVQAAPLAITGAIPSDTRSEDETSLKPEIGADVQPVPTPVSPIPKVESENGSKRTGTYQSLTFEILTSFDIREPDWDKMEDPKYFASLNLTRIFRLKLKR